MDAFDYYAGRVPVLVSMPHTATGVPDSILARFTDAAKRLPDTDWHIERLWAFAREMGAHVLVPRYSRYVVDLNRGADDASLYPGQFTTGLCPATFFDGRPLYADGGVPTAEEVRQRVVAYWQPYHTQLQAALAAMHKQHGVAVLVDAHSIRSEVPTLFEGILPDLNLGTANRASADAGLAAALEEVCRASGYSFVHNGRFKGGYITRQYGQPQHGIHAVQLELAQKNYMQEEFPFAYDEQKAAALQGCLQAFLGAAIRWAG